MENIKEKILCILRYYATLLLCFVPLRLLFLAANSTESYSLHDYADVALYGLPLDIAVAGYLTAIPLLFAIAGTFLRIPLRKMLIPYNVLAATAIAAAFIADISLYPFWGFKLDASFLIRKLTTLQSHLIHLTNVVLKCVYRWKMLVFQSSITIRRLVLQDSSKSNQCLARCLRWRITL